MPNFMTTAEVSEICSELIKDELLWASRASEIVGLKLSDFMDGGHSAIVTGKGNKQRKVYFDIEARKALAEYLADRKKVLAENFVRVRAWSHRATEGCEGPLD